MDIIEVLDSTWMQTILMLVLQALFIWLVIVMALRKGYEWWIGLIIGMFTGILGIIVIAVLPDQNSKFDR